MLLFTLLYAGQTLASENSNENDIQERRPGYRKRLTVIFYQKYLFSTKNLPFLAEHSSDFSSKMIFLNPKVFCQDFNLSQEGICWSKMVVFGLKWLFFGLKCVIFSLKWVFFRS